MPINALKGCTLKPAFIGRAGGCLLLVAAALTLSSCAQMPAAAPSYSEVKYSASSSANDYVLIDVDQNVLESLSLATPEGFSEQFHSSAPRASLRIAVGDTLQISIIEQATGLLSQPSAQSGAQASTPGSLLVGSTTNFLPTTVEQDGSINVPFVGRLAVAGRSPDFVRQSIERVLKVKAVNPQVQIALVKDKESDAPANSATVGGEVNKAGLYALRPSGSRLMDLIAEAGGAKYPAYEIAVHLIRHGREDTASLQNVLDHPSENIFVYPQDNIYLARNQRTYSVLGASSKVGHYNFDSAHLNLAQALATAGGFVDGASDPAGVFVFRQEPASLVAALKPKTPLPLSGRQPVIYRIDLRSTAGYFVSKQFEIRDNDIIMLANSDAAQFQKLLNLLQSVTSMAANVRSTLSTTTTTTTTTTK